MLVDYFYWQYIIAPRWLILLLWNLQRALVQLFSVKLMLRTLFAHWHKDSMPFHGGTLGQLGMSILWNIISRFIGFIIRTLVILIWLVAEAVFIALAVFSIPLLFLWPALVIVGIATSIALAIT